MSERVQGGILQLVLALGLFYAFWSGALDVLIDSIRRAVNGEQPGRLWDAVTAGTGPGRKA